MNKVSSRKKGYSIHRASWGYELEWYDGRGTYCYNDARHWWGVPFRFVQLWLEVNYG